MNILWNGATFANGGPASVVAFGFCDEPSREQPLDDLGTGATAQGTAGIAVRATGDCLEDGCLGIGELAWVAMMISDDWWVSSLTVAAKDRQQFVQPGLHSSEVADMAPMDGIGVVTEVVVGAAWREWRHFGVSDTVANRINVGGDDGNHHCQAEPHRRSSASRGL